MKTLLTITLTLALAGAAYAGCWTGNGYSDPTTNFVEAQVWPGDGGVLTSMEFYYTTDGTDPFTSGTVMMETGVFFQLAGNNDWYQATLTATGGDLVRWFAASWSADAEYCESEEFSFTSGAVVEEVPNLVGDCEDEFGLPNDWNNGDAGSDMADPDLDGVYELTLTAVAPFSGAGYQVVGVSGSWSPQFPGDSNIPIAFNPGDQVTFYLDTNPMADWMPETNAVSDNYLAANTHTWAAVGGWQGWDPANAATQLTDMGGGVHYLSVPFTGDMLGAHEVKFAADGGWGLQCGPNGYGSNSATAAFEVTAEVYVEFWFHVSGRIKVVVTDTVSNEDMEWSEIKSIFR